MQGPIEVCVFYGQVPLFGEPELYPAEPVQGSLFDGIPVAFPSQVGKEANQYNPDV